MKSDATLEQRIERIEQIIERVREYALQHPMGKMIINLLGL